MRAPTERGRTTPPAPSGYAPRTFASSLLVNPMTASARNAMAAPIQPTEVVMCVVNVSLRKAGVIIGGGAAAYRAALEILAQRKLTDG